MSLRDLAEFESEKSCASLLLWQAKIKATGEKIETKNFENLFENKIKGTEGKPYATIGRCHVVLCLMQHAKETRLVVCFRFTLGRFVFEVCPLF
jgi:hypothetical protein